MAQRSILPVLSPPATKLAIHRRLSPLAGVAVSPLCLGAMSIGDKWAEFGLGAMDKESSFKLLDAFYDAGGNFIDTANNYQVETSERFIGEWMETRGIRDQIVVATKYSSCYKVHQDGFKQKSAYLGNSVKALQVSVHESLEKLRTTYIDILYVHWWDHSCSIEEVMNGLHNLVVAGKVLYLGISDTPAWVVSQANQYARDHGKTPFSIYQGEWNVLERSFERDIIPMARSLGLALAPFNVLCGGKIRTDAEEQARRASGEAGRTMFGPNWERDAREREIVRVLGEVAAQVGARSVQAVAIAYVMQKTVDVFPVIGGRKVEHLHANIEALSVVLEDKHVAAIEGAVAFDPGFPHKLIGDGKGYGWTTSMFNHVQNWPIAQPLRPAP